MENTLNLHHSAAVVWRNRFVIGIAMLLGGLLAFAISTAQPHMYSASARIVIQPVTTDPTDPFGTAIDPIGVDIDTQVEVLRSGSVAERVMGVVGAEAVRSSTASVRALTLDSLEVLVDSPDPALSARIANAYVTQYLGFRRDSIRQAALDISTDIERRTQTLQERIAEIDRTLPALADEPDAQATVAGLTAERENLTDLIGALRARKASLEASSAEAIGGVGRIIQTAIAPDGPSSPDPARDVVIGVVLAGVLSIGVIFVREQVRPRIFTEEDAYRATGSPVLAIPARRPLRTGRSVLLRRLPASRGNEGETRRGTRRSATPPQIDVEPGSPRWEAARTLRARLWRRGSGAMVGKVVVLAPDRDRDMVDVAVDLAYASALAGQRTILVSGDVHDRGLDRLLGLDRCPGLADVVGRDADIRDVILKAAIDDLYILPAGHVSPEVPDPFSSPLLPKIVDEIAGMADAVIIGAPPVVRGADAAITTELADAAVLVLKAGRTREADARVTVELARDLGVPIAYVLLLDAAADGLQPAPKIREWSPGSDVVATRSIRPAREAVSAGPASDDVQADVRIVSSDGSVIAPDETMRLSRSAETTHGSRSSRPRAPAERRKHEHRTTS